MPAGTEKEPAGKFGRITLSVSFTSLLTLVFLVVVAMTAAYIWGVMTGRAQSSEAPAPIIAQQEKPAEPEQADSRILQAHELQFTQVLRGENPAPKTVPAEPVPQKPVSVGAIDKDAPTPVAEESKPDPAVTTPKPDVWDYIYQVAALKDEQSVDSLRQKLEGQGLRTRMERSGKLYLVMVLMRGDDARAADLARITEALRLGEPLLRSRKAATP